MIFKISIVTITTLSMVFLAVFLNVTTPATAGLFGVLIIFFFAYLSSLGLVTFFLFFISHAVNRVFYAIDTKKSFQALSFKRSYYYSTVIAAAPVMLVGLQSVGAIGLYEFILVLIFVVVGCLYVSKKI